MDVTLQKHCAKYIYVVPEGLRELMSDISREVLRHQPHDFYNFIADYLDALLITREHARISSRLVQFITDTSETVVALLHEIGLTREEADRSAAIIQRAFRQYLDRTKPTLKDEDQLIADILEELQIDYNVADQAAKIIQTAFRKFKQRKLAESRLLSDIIDWRVAAKSAIKLYRQTGVTPEEAHRAATLIKAAYKGYYTRRLLGKLKQETADIVDDASRTGKSVHLDYLSINLHVDFDSEEERIDASCPVDIVEDILEEIITTVLDKEESLEAFIKHSILEEIIRKVVGEETGDEDIELFVRESILGEIIRKIEAAETLEKSESQQIVEDILNNILDIVVPPEETDEIEFDGECENENENDILEEFGEEIRAFISTENQDFIE